MMARRWTVIDAERNLVRGVDTRWVVSESDGVECGCTKRTTVVPTLLQVSVTMQTAETPQSH